MSPEPRTHRILFYDLETAPLLAHIWNPRDDYVTHDRLIHDSFLLAWAAKWQGERRVHAGVLTGGEHGEARRQDDGRIVAELADLIRQADVIVAHNGDRFDLPVFNTRLLRLGLAPLGPVRTIDTLTLARKNFRLAYNKLDYLGEALGLGRKMETGGFKLWQAAYHGDENALRRMSRYNVQDVRLLEQVFDAIKPYVRGLTRLVDASVDGQFACPSCGSDSLTCRGTYRTQVSTFQRYQCNDCGRYCRARAARRERLAVHPL